MVVDADYPLEDMLGDTARRVPLRQAGTYFLRFGRSKQLQILQNTSSTSCSSRFSFFSSN